MIDDSKTKVEVKGRITIKYFYNKDSELLGFTTRNADGDVYFDVWDYDGSYIDTVKTINDAKRILELKNIA